MVYTHIDEGLQSDNVQEIDERDHKKDSQDLLFILSRICDDATHCYYHRKDTSAFMDDVKGHYRRFKRDTINDDGHTKKLCYRSGYLCSECKNSIEKILHQKIE